MMHVIPTFLGDFFIDQLCFAYVNVMCIHTNCNLLLHVTHQK